MINMEDMKLKQLILKNLNGMLMLPIIPKKLLKFNTVIMMKLEEMLLIDLSIWSINLKNI